ncbi:MAG: DUF1015 domain-containing protein [Chloroflexi bacterium]|nr:DUF1015 domain-containing protein [Chloroflexota bacterium]
MKSYEKLGIQIPETLLPRPGIDLQKWAVIACDQFTSQPEYWEQVEGFVDGAPSTYRLILPEVFLGKDEEQSKVKEIQASMQDYLTRQILIPQDGFIYVERQMGSGKVRKGLVLALDLEQYDYNKGSQSLIRATEGTIIERLPPRIKIREGAPLELPHIIVLIDDPDGLVIDPLSGQKPHLEKLYDVDLMLGSGHLEGYRVGEAQVERQVIQGLERLADPREFQTKYGVGPAESVLLFAMGDGNHSLATAKAIWEKVKSQVGLNHPARYALVEIENLHDPALEFEPIHRVLFGVNFNPIEAMSKYFTGGVVYRSCRSQAEMVALVDNQSGQGQQVGIISADGFGVDEILQPVSNLPVGSLQAFLDHILKDEKAAKIDYVHGQEIVCHLGAKPGNLGFYLPAMEKSDLFKTVILDGALPRKTFSMGEAKEKRFYMECRKIT